MRFWKIIIECAEKKWVTSCTSRLYKLSVSRPNSDYNNIKFLWDDDNDYCVHVAHCNWLNCSGKFITKKKKNSRKLIYFNCNCDWLYWKELDQKTRTDTVHALLIARTVEFRETFNNNYWFSSQLSMGHCVTENIWRVCWCDESINYNCCKKQKTTTKKVWC